MAVIAALPSSAALAGAMLRASARAKITNFMVNLQTTSG
jgi:hypothetical protein